MPIRTDLAMESLSAGRSDTGRLRGVRSTERLRDGFHVTEVEILDGDGAEAVGKPIGRYVTLDCGRVTPENFGASANALADELRPFLPSDERAPVLMVGLGNRAVTPDALGPLAAEHTMITRHLALAQPDKFGELRPVAALAPGVLGTTGIESLELIFGAAERVKPAAVLAVDALASASVERLCSTVQISSSGIVPGSGVGNSRAALDQSTLGVPVIAVGVPTVVDAATIAEQLCGSPPSDDRYGAMFVTPREIDRQVGEMARLIGTALSVALHGVDVDTVSAWLA